MPRTYDNRKPGATEIMTISVKAGRFVLCDLTTMTPQEMWIRWIRDGLEKPGRSQSGLARAMEVAAPRVSEILSGRRQLHLDEAPKAASYFEMPLPIEYLELFPSSEDVRIFLSLSEKSRSAALPMLVRIHEAEAAAPEKAPRQED